VTSTNQAGEVSASLFASLFAVRAWARDLPDGVKVFVLSLTVNIGYWAILRSHYVPMTDAERTWLPHFGGGLRVGM